MDNKNKKYENIQHDELKKHNKLKKHDESPSVNQFESNYELSQDLIKSLDKLGYTEPTKVQHAVLSELAKKQDYIVQSETGSGKTAAFGIPIIDQLVVDEKSLQVLVLTPTRELTVQVCDELAKIGRYKKVRTLPIYGKQAFHIQINQLKQRIHIVVGTPGRVADLIEKGHLVLDKVKFLVLDEADELLNKGFLPEVNGIISRLPKERQTFLFSATMPDAIESICRKNMVNPLRIEVESESPGIETIVQTFYEIDGDWKDIQLKNLLNKVKPASCLIFCNTQKKADEVQVFLKRSNFKCDTLHGGMNQRDRLISIDKFRQKELPILVATDLAARGIHVDELDLVINYNVPSECENYVHRIGRTGRAGHIGRAVTFVSVHEASDWQDVVAYIGHKVPKGTINEFLPENEALENRKQQELLSQSKGAIKVSPGVKSKESKAQKKDASEIKQDITLLRIGGGRQKKIRAADILGSISQIDGITREDIGIIDIRDSSSYVEIFNHKGCMVLEQLNKQTIKGKQLKVVEIVKPKSSLYRS